MTDLGPNPYTVDIAAVTKANANYRTTAWTGRHLQLTLMSIEPGHDIGLEMHADVDQFLRVEQGRARVQMGVAENDLTFDTIVEDDWAILVPAGTWHNLTNVGDEPLQVYSLYAPPQHPHGTIHATKADSDAGEHHR